MISIFIQKLLSLIIFLFIFFHISCSSYEIKNKNTFVFATYDDVKDWDPATAFSLEVLPMSNIYEPLLWYDASEKNHKLVPGLAKSYSKSKDALEWTFILRENVKFHDGSTFDASTVKFVVERNKTFNRGASYIWSAVKEVIVLDKYKVLFRLNLPVALDRIVSSQYGAWMYSKKFSEISPDSIRKGYASGTGPYYLSDWSPNNKIILNKYENYWGGWNKKNYFEKINIKIISESSTRLQMVKKGIADYAALIPVQLLNSLEGHSDVEIGFYPSWVNHFYLLNTEKFPTNNIWVRKAIAATFDRTILTKYIYKNTGKTPKGLIPSNIPLFSEPDSLIDFNLDIARSWLDSSKITLNDIDIDLSYVSSSEEYRLTALMLLDNLRRIGINLDLKPGLWSVNWERAKNLESSPNIISMAWWPTYPTPSDWLFGLYHSQTPPLFNLSHYSNPKIDSLINEAWKNEIINPEKSKYIYKKIQNILIADCVVIPAVDLKIQSVKRKDIKGFKGNPAYSTILFYHLWREQ